VQEDHRQSHPVAAFLDVQRMHRVDLELVGSIGFQRREKGFHLKSGYRMGGWLEIPGEE
jgi:hypothetical protein